MGPLFLCSAHHPTGVSRRERCVSRHTFIKSLQLGAAAHELHSKYFAKEHVSCAGSDGAWSNRSFGLLRLVPRSRSMMLLLSSCKRRLGVSGIRNVLAAHEDATHKRGSATRLTAQEQGIRSNRMHACRQTLRAR